MSENTNTNDENINDVQDVVSDTVQEADKAKENVEKEIQKAAGSLETVPLSDTKEKKKKRKKKDPFAYEKDIKYRGPLSYRHLKILGWLCIVLAQVGVVVSIGDKMGMGIEIPFFSNAEIMRNISGLALPLLLISIFGFLLQKRGAYKGTLITYALLAIGLAALFILFYEHYLLGLIQPIADTDKAGAEELLTGALFEATDFKGFVAFNIFIDMFLCTLVMFFMDYTPKRVFTGKKIIIFRSFVILPALYEIICIYLKIMLTNHLIALPLWVSPFLTTKPPISMIMFFSIIRYIKTQEKRYLKTGRTLEQYDDYCKTNIHSFRFSKHLITIILAYAILDAISVILLAAIHIVLVDGIMNSAELTGETMIRAMEIVREWGFGETVSMIELIPVVLLFSYTRTHKSPLIDTIIPIVGVILIVFVYFEGAFLVLQDWLGYAAGELRFVIGAMEMSGGL